MKWPIPWRIPPTLRTSFAISAVRSPPVRSKPDNDSPHRVRLRFDFAQMNLYGLTDSLATITCQPNECPHGHIALRSNGLCLGCLLQVGLTEDEDFGGESFDALLSEIEI